MGVEHPDAAWLEQVSSAIQSWLHTPVSTPTSQVTGGGAVGRVEARLSALHENRPALLVPSATLGLRLALATLGVRPGDEVLIPRWDWSASFAVVRSLGAVPVIVATDPATLTIDPRHAAQLRTHRTRAAVATHLLGIPADVPALRSAVPGLQIVEDCAQSLGSTLDDRPVGVFGDAAVLSFGPGKRVDVGELGAVLLRDAALAELALRSAAHPIRQQLNGLDTPNLVGLSTRPHPLAAVLLNATLDADKPASLIVERQRLATQLLQTTDLPLLGVDQRRGVASVLVPVDPACVADSSLPEWTSLSYGDVLDIQGFSAGRPTSRRLALIGRACRAPRRRR